jgi:lipoxygenase homology domain-containing protein 1
MLSKHIATQVQIPAGEHGPEIAEVEYHITTWTGDVKFAGTDADVFMELQGLRDGKCIATKRHLLSSSKNDFERGHVDHFSIRSDALLTRDVW